MNNKRTPTPVILAVLTLITVVFWIAFGIIRIITQVEDPQVPAEVLEPLNPELDTRVLSDLQARVHLSESEIGNIQLIQPATPEPLVEPDFELQPTTSSPTATNEADVTTPPESTDSGAQTTQ